MIKRKILFILLLCALSQTSLPAAQWQTKRYYAHREVDSIANTPNVMVPFSVFAVCDSGMDVYTGGDFGYILKIHKPTWNISCYLGQNQYYNRTTFIAGTDGFCHVPDATTDIKIYNNNMYIADGWYHSIFKYDMINNFFDIFTGIFNTAGNATGDITTAKYNWPEFIDVKGNTLYVSDKNNHCIRGVDLITQTSYTIAGLPGTSGYVDDTLVNSRFNTPQGIAVDSVNNTIYVVDANIYIRAINVVDNIVTTLKNVGGNIDGMVIDSSNTYLYLADLSSKKILRVKIADGTVVNFTNGGNGDNVTDLIVNTTNAKFRTPDNLSLAPDDSSMAVSDEYNWKVRYIDMTTTAVYNLAGYGHYTPNSTLNTRCGYSNPDMFEFYNDDLYIGHQDGRMIHKITKNGYLSQVAGMGIDTFGGTDGTPTVSTMGSVNCGVMVSWTAQPKLWVQDAGCWRTLDINTNTLTTEIGLLNNYGYAEANNNTFRMQSGLGGCDAYGNTIVFSDRSNQIIRGIWIDSKQSFLIAGQQGSGGDVDGVGLTTTALFNNPIGVTFDPGQNGNIIYFYDKYAGKIKCIDIAANSVSAIVLNLLTTGGSLSSWLENDGSTSLFFYAPETFPVIKKYNTKTQTIDIIDAGILNVVWQYVGDWDSDTTTSTINQGNLCVHAVKEKGFIFFDNTNNMQTARYIDTNTYLKKIWNAIYDGYIW